MQRQMPTRIHIVLCVGVHTVQRQKPTRIHIVLCVGVHTVQRTDANTDSHCIVCVEVFILCRDRSQHGFTLYCV